MTLGEAFVAAILSGADIILRLGAGIALFVATLVSRDHLGRRILIMFSLLLAAFALLFVPPLVGQLLGVYGAPLDRLLANAQNGFASTAESFTAYYLAQFIVFSALLLVSTGVLRFLFQASVWTSLFCCSAGYAVENLASGVAELFWILAYGTMSGQAEIRASLEYRALLWAVTLAVYLAYYLLVGRRTSRRDLERISGRSMLGMMVVVVWMIIGLDLVIKALCDQGLHQSYAVALRLAHACICIFVVWMEYELLINRQLVEERNITERLLVEHARQYDASRQSMAAINARVHDIRHAVLRTLAATGSPLKETTAREVLHEIDVLDATVRTGNEALDTVLAQQQLICRREGITLTYVADGHALSFMMPADVYTLFSTMLSKAIEAECGVADAGRSISLTIRGTLGVCSIHLESSVGKGEYSSPDTTTADDTYDEQTVRMTLERYDGTLAISTTGHTHLVDALIPMPSTAG